MDYTDIDILFAEDSADDAALTIRALKKSGFSNKLHHVKDGAEALDYMFCKGEYKSRNKEQLPKVIFLDLKMPKIGGMEVLAIIKSDEKLKLIPIVILTSSNEDPDIKKCYDIGANSYIVKPIEIDQFYKVIEELGLYWMIRNQAVE